MIVCSACSGPYREDCPHKALCSPATRPDVGSASPWRRVVDWFARAPEAPPRWTEARVVDLLTRLRAAESFAGDPLLSEAVGALAVCAAHLPAAPAWQDISTAPKDGTWVLLHSPDSIHAAFIGRWCDDSDFPDGGAWWPDHDAGFPIDVDPSHWQPLPSPPKQGD